VIFRLSAGFLVGVLALLAAVLYLSDYYTAEQQRLAAAGDITGAMEASRKAVRLDPFDTDALQAQSFLWRQQKEQYRAVLALKEAIERDPNNYLPYLTLANLRLGMGDLDAAAERYRDVLELNPNAVSARSSLAQTLARQGKLQEAKEMYEVLEEEKNITYRDRYDLGRIQVRTGEPDEGVKNIRRARRQAAELRRPRTLAGFYGPGHRRCVRRSGTVWAGAQDSRAEPIRAGSGPSGITEPGPCGLSRAGHQQ
jgi:tetratricopeptide (TPR) repeat protein